jgi:acyl-coenzyme A thioesterase PaaI-like protein
VSFGPKGEALRGRVLRRLPMTLYLWRMLPLAAFAGLRITRLDAEACTVTLPGGWRTRNPFASTYFAAQAMAAEMSTGAPALVFTRAAPASVALILTGLTATFTRRVQGGSVFTFADVTGLRAAIDGVARQGGVATYTGRALGRTADGRVAAEFDVTWSFKRREA